ncbi:MAG: zinc ribbon domain-containing protein [Elusimicrobiota bacterium]
MEVTQSTLENLKKLQELDLIRNDILERLNEIPRLIKAEKKEADDVKVRLKQAREDLKETKNILNTKEMDQSDAHDFIVDHKGKLNTLKSNEAYRKMQQEIKNKEKEIDEIENEILSCYEQIDKNEESIKKLEKKLEQKNKEIKATQKTLKNEEKKLQTNLEQIEEKIEPCREEIEDNILKRYDKIKSQKSNALVKVEKMSCSGCHSQLTPQKINEAKSGKKLPRCENCYRFLYIEKK